MTKTPERQSPLWQLMLWAADGLKSRLSSHTRSGYSQESSSALHVPQHARSAVLDLQAHGIRALGLTQAHLTRFSRGPTSEALRFLLAVSLGALRRSYRPDYVVVDQTVEACERLSNRSKGFVNAFLRSVIGGKSGIEETQEVLCNAPLWWRERLARAGLIDVYAQTCLLPPVFATWGRMTIETFGRSSSMHKAFVPIGRVLTPSGLRPPALFKTFLATPKDSFVFKTPQPSVSAN